MQAITSIDAMTQALAPQCYAYNIKTVMTILLKKKNGMVLLELNWNPFLQILNPMKKSCSNIIFKEWFFIYHINCGVIQGFPAPRKAVTTHVKKCRTFFFFFFFTCVDIANQLLTRHSPLAPLGQVDE